METKKQHIVVRALIVNNGNILLVKRIEDGSELAGKLELPGGQVEFGEFPEQALSRELQEEIGQALSDYKIEKVYSYIYLNTHIIGICYRIELDYQFLPNLNKYEHIDHKWIPEDSVNEMPLTDETRLILGLNSDVVVVTNTTALSVVKLFTDGGSRGNPGPSALGYVIYDAGTGNVIKDGSKYLGITTNNQAEYQAVKAGLEACKLLGASKVEVFLDSQLVANQLNGIYKIKNRDLWPIHTAILEIKNTFAKDVSFTYIPRELNKAADAKVNEELDKAVSADN